MHGHNQHDKKRYPLFQNIGLHSACLASKPKFHKYIGMAEQK